MRSSNSSGCVLLSEISSHMLSLFRSSSSPRYSMSRPIQNCGRYFLTTSGRQPKYCDGIAPQDGRLTCRQYGAMQHQKEQNKQHPVYRIFSTRTNTIRKHHQRGRISDELRQAALKLAEEYRDKALLDNDYASHSYAQDMEQEHLYAEARKRLK